jgi:hypothetical protein
MTARFFAAIARRRWRSRPARLLPDSVGPVFRRLAGASLSTTLPAQSALAVYCQSEALGAGLLELRRQAVAANDGELADAVVTIERLLGRTGAGGAASLSRAAAALHSAALRR